LTRSEKNVSGSNRFSVAVAACPERLRPSSGAIDALGAAHVAWIASPGMFCSVAATCTSTRGTV
jgi:hypothetical protein